MKILYRSAGVLLLSLMLLAAVTFSSSAAFHDVYDSETARALELLDTLGLVNGYPDGGYHPDEPLTRAQFCKFAVLLMELEDQLMSASQKTLFSDVTSVHWAAPYVNLAYSKSLIQGYGNGCFGPDDNILYEQAVLISLRILGYDTNDYGNYYPDDPLRFADKIGLTSSLDRIAGEALSRGETARLLYALLSCTTKKGEMYAASLADRTVKSVILLDEHTASPTGLLNCARFYASGSAVWYPLATELPAEWIGAEGTALLNSDGELIAFLPGSTSYKVVDGILLSASYRAKNASGASGYYVKLHTGKGVELYPRANTISTNLVGSSGTLILNDTEYATAFISDDSTVYNLTDDAILINTNAVSDTGITGCAEFRIGGKTVWFRQSFYTYLPDSLIGSVGTVMYDDNDTLVDFLTDGTQYSLLSGIIVKVDSTEVTILTEGNLAQYHSTVSLSSQSGTSSGGSGQMGVSGSLAVSASQVGSYGMFMLNEQNYIVSFTADSSAKYTIKNDAILLSANAGTGYNAGAKFYVDGKAAVYAYSASYSGLGTAQSTDLSYLYQYLYGQSTNLNAMMNSATASQGTLLLDSENKVVCFIPDGTAYRALSGVLVSANNSSYYGNYVSFSTGSQTYTFPQQQSLSGAAGTYGTLLLTSSGYAVTFIADSSDGYSSSSVGILVSVGDEADDGITRLVKISVNGKDTLYALSASATISPACLGQRGRLMLDANGRAVGFAPEADNRAQTAVVSAVNADVLQTISGREYTPAGSTTVVFAASGTTTWNRLWNKGTTGSTGNTGSTGSSETIEDTKVSGQILPGDTLTFYFTDLGALSMIVVHP